MLADVVKDGATVEDVTKSSCTVEIELGFVSSSDSSSSLRDVLHFVVRSDVRLAGDPSVSKSVVSLNRIGCFGTLVDTLRCIEPPFDDVGLISSEVLDPSSVLIEAVAFEVDGLYCIGVCGSEALFCGVVTVEGLLDLEGQKDEGFVDAFVIEPSSWSSSSSEDPSGSFL